MHAGGDESSAKAEELYEWLNEMEFSRPKKMMARDFADGVFMAEILKRYYPRMVDLHNYPAANAVANKLKNWQTLNSKVLVPLGLGQPEKFLRNIASGVRGTIEQLLYQVKNKIDEVQKKDDEEMEQGIEYRFSPEVICFEDEPFQSTVTLAEFKNLRTSLNSKEGEILVLNAKVKHLESLISLKDQRIEDLTAQLNHCTCLRNFSNYSVEDFNKTL